MSDDLTHLLAEALLAITDALDDLDRARELANRIFKDYPELFGAEEDES